MKEVGKVKSLDGNMAEVVVDKKTECDKCGMCIFPKGASTVTFNAINEKGAEEGDEVVIEKKSDGRLLSAILVFLVPLILIGLSALITYLFIKVEIWILILSVISVILWYTILAMIDKKIKKKSEFCYEIVLIVKKGEENEQDNRNNDSK